MTKALITGKIDSPELKGLITTLQEELTLLGVSSSIVVPKDNSSIEQDFHIVFSVGGDGSFVSAARKYVHKKVPIVAIKAGRLGFLPNIALEDFKTELPKLFQKNNPWTKRMLITGEKCSTQPPLVALNEFLFSNDKKGSLCELTVCINDAAAMKVRADGLIISTPTGSTAYNLSAGGAISLPDMNLISITPVCSHILGERPLVIGTNNFIQVINHSDKSMKVWVDGQDSLDFEPEDCFTIGEALFVDSLHASTSCFFHTLSQKLGWTSGHQKNRI